jgi:hypothetical protein
VQVHVTAPHVAQLGSAQPGVQQQQDDRLVAARVERALGGGEYRLELVRREGLDLVGPIHGRGHPLHRGDGDLPLGDEPVKEGAQDLVVGLDCARRNGPRHARVPPPPARFLVPVREVVQEPADLVGAALRHILLTQEPEELAERAAPFFHRARGVLVDVAGEQPGIDEAREKVHGNGGVAGRRPRICAKVVVFFAFRSPSVG